jgi:putative transmembrane protein PGPGW
MLEKIERTWQRFKADPPGTRFQQQFKRRREVARTPMQKALVLGSGVLLTGVGILLFFLPGPGVLFVMLGAVLIAQQSLTVARALDWTEIRLRKLLARSFGAWRHSSAPLKIFLVGLAVVGAAIVGFGAFKFLTA